MPKTKPSLFIYLSLILLLFSSAFIPSYAFNLTQKLSECQRHLDANRLTSGRGGTALACYEAVLQQEPTNRKAWLGLEQMTARYQRWKQRASDRRQDYKVRSYQTRLDLVNKVKNRFQSRLKTSISTKPEVFVQLGHLSGVNAVAFSPDGRLA